MCIFYQDELGVCCINGLDWSDGFTNNPKCVEDRYDVEDRPECPDRIAIKDVWKMKKKLDKLMEMKNKYRLTLQLHALSFLKEFEPLLEDSE